MKIVVYQSLDPLREGERCIAWLTEERHVTDKAGRRTGRTKTAFLPVYFFGEGPEVAECRARAFWDDEKAKAAAKKERGRKITARRAA